MNKLNKIFLFIIVILVIAFAIMTYLYFDMRNTAKENLYSYINLVNELSDVNIEKNQNSEQIIEYVKSIDDVELRASIINSYINNQYLTQEVANKLY